MRKELSGKSYTINKKDEKMEEFEIAEIKKSSQVRGAKIAVVGVGGGGGNMLNYLGESEIADRVKTIAANTDLQALESVKADTKIQLGPKLTGGKGAGMDPDIGKLAALESYEEIKKALMQ